MLIRQFIRCLKSCYEIPRILELDGIKTEVTENASHSGTCVTTEYTILSDGIRIWAYRFSCSGLSPRHTICYTNNTKPNQHRTYYFKEDLWGWLIYNKIARKIGQPQNCRGIEK